MPMLRLRPERPADHPEVQALHRAAFGDHGVAVAELVPDLRALLTDTVGLSIVAESTDRSEESVRIIGHVLFTPAWLDAPDRLVQVQVLSPLAVRPDAQGSGVGTALVRHGVAELSRRDVPVLFLEGSPAYYPRFGFAPGASFGFRKPSLRIPDQAFQALLLPAHRPWMTGTLVYPPAFWNHDCVGLRPPLEGAGERTG